MSENREVVELIIIWVSTSCDGIEHEVVIQQLINGKGVSSSFFTRKAIDYSDRAAVIRLVETKLPFLSITDSGAPIILKDELTTGEPAFRRKIRRKDL